MLDKQRVLAVTKCDLLDDELCEMLRETTPDDVTVVFISSVTGQGIAQLKDVLWQKLNSESNKLQNITKDETLVHRDKDMSRFNAEMAAEGEDNVVFFDEAEDIDDYEIEDLEDYELEDFDDNDIYAFRRLFRHTAIPTGQSGFCIRHAFSRSIHNNKGHRP